jgi:hypothetical protein
MKTIEQEEQTDALQRLTKDLRLAAQTMTSDEARFLVDSYYQMQDNRIRSDGQVRSMDTEPHAVIEWVGANAYTLENRIKAALGAYAKANYMGQWALEICGIGPVIAAGLLAYIDITQAPTAGHIWRFAGLDPTSKWAKGQKRPWCATLKVLCWKIGESFVKVSGKDDAYYGQQLLKRKAFETEKNLRGDYAAQAALKLETTKIGQETDAWVWYSGNATPEEWRTYVALEDTKAKAKLLAGIRARDGGGVAMLPPAHIHARAKRWAVKLFLSHWHDAAYRHHYKTAPPLPYPIAILGHAHVVSPPTIETERTTSVE